MNDLEFTFEQSPWEAYRMTKGMGDTISAVTLLSLLEDADDRNIVRIIIQLGRNLNMQVIAEGVECAEQEAYLRNEGCDIVQGYFYSRPLTAPALRVWMHNYEQQLGSGGQ